MRLSDEVAKPSTDAKIGNRSEMLGHMVERDAPGTSDSACGEDARSTEDRGTELRFAVWCSLPCLALVCGLS